MKGIIRRALAMLMALAMMMQMSAGILNLAVYAADEPAGLKVSQEVNEEKKEEAKAEVKEEVKAESKSNSEAKAINKEEKKEEAKAESKIDSEAKASNIEEKKAEAKVEEAKAEVKEVAKAESKGEASKESSADSNAPIEASVKNAGDKNASEASDKNANNAINASEMMELGMKSAEGMNEILCAEKEEEPVVEKVLPTTIKVVYHFFQMDAAGNYEEAKTVNKSFKKTTAASSIALSTANTYVKNKSVTINGKAASFINTWNTADGNSAAFPLTMNYETAGEKLEDGDTVNINLYAQYRCGAKITLHFEQLRQANGTFKSVEQSNTLSWGSGWSFTQKKLETTTGLRSGQTFSYGGITYTYNGMWKDGNGNIITPDASISLKVGDGVSAGNNYYFTEDTDLYFTPMYDEEVVYGLDYYFTDKISTGSGSWSNASTEGIRSPFSSLTHTFKDPSKYTTVEHYRSIEWLNPENGATYNEGDSLTLTMEKVTEDIRVEVFAVWQPSVIVNFYGEDGELAASAEDFAKINAYEAGAAEVDEEADFLGWFTEDDERVEEGAEFEAPEATIEPIEQKTINLYAKYEVVEEEIPEEPIVNPEIEEETPVVPAAPIVNPENETPVETPAEDPEEEADDDDNEDVVLAARPAANNADDDDDEVVAAITDNTTPLSGIENTAAPLAEAPGSWALINLIAAILTVVGAVLAIIRRRDEEDAEDDDENRNAGIITALKMTGAVTAVVSAALFLLTEDMTLRMVLADRWTLVMIILLAVQAIAAALVKKACSNDDDDEAKAGEVSYQA